MVFYTFVKKTEFKSQVLVGNEISLYLWARKFNVNNYFTNCHKHNVWYIYPVLKFNYWVQMYSDKFSDHNDITVYWWVWQAENTKLLPENINHVFTKWRMIKHYHD